jgi:hypothetical protein
MLCHLQENDFLESHSLRQTLFLLGLSGIRTIAVSPKIVSYRPDSKPPRIQSRKVAEAKD